MKKKNLIRLQDITFGIVAASSLFVLFGVNGANAVTSAVDEVTITVPASCSLTNTIGSAHTATIETGVYQDNIGETTFKVFCNDNEGFAVYAVGYTNDEFGNTTMKPNTLAVSNAIATGTATSGNTSNWAMKLTAVSGDYTPTLETGFNTYHVIPELYTKVASFSSNTDVTTGSSFKSTYGAYISGAQLADNYTGKVKYTVIHPANADTPITPVATMQNMSSMTNPEAPSTSMVCTGVPSYVIDGRDDHIYTIQRLADGNCWMMENLDLGRTELTVDLTSENTNLETTIPAATFNSWIKNSGTSNVSSAELIPLSASNTSNGLEVDSTSNTPYGTLYNYCSASAGTICINSRIDSRYDICPAGWRLPTGGDSGELNTLYMYYNSYALMRTSIVENGVAFALAGLFSSNPRSQGESGSYWSSTAGDTQGVAYVLSFSESNVSINQALYDYGRSVRCILKEPPKTISDLTYLQDFKDFYAKDKASVLNSMEYNTTYNLVDNRDNHTYAVAKLKDGNIWMAENLDLGRTSLTTDLTSQNTNLSTTVVASTFNNWIKTSGTGSYTSAELIPISGVDSVSNAPYGTLYNYCAVSAGTICAISNTDNAVYDICPAGWRLPTGGNGGEYQSLYNVTDYNSFSDFRASISDGGAAFVLSGAFSDSTPHSRGNGGYYWGSTCEEDVYMSRLYFYSTDSLTNVYPANYGYRNAGYAVRCIAK